MARYRYWGTTSDGSPATGELSARSEPELAIKLLRRGIILGRALPALAPVQQLTVRLFKSSEITRITRQVALLLENHISVLESIELAREGTQDHLLSQVLDSIAALVRQGRSVAEAFAQYPDIFDTLYVNMLSAGEISGTLELSFARLADYREQQETTLRKFRSAMAYPLLVLLVALAVVIILVVYIVPVFEGMYANFGAQLPTLTARVVGLSRAVREYSLLWLSLGSTVVLAGTFLVFAARFRKHWHALLLYIPGVRILVLKLVTMRYCRTLGSLLETGVDILTAAEIAARGCGNLALEMSLLKVPSQLMAGQGLSDSLATYSYFPKPALRLVAAGERAGQLGPSLLRAASFYEKETATTLATVTSLIEPVIIIILGVVVAFLLVALYLPLFDLVESIE